MRAEFRFAKTISVVMVLINSQELRISNIGFNPGFTRQYSCERRGSRLILEDHSSRDEIPVTRGLITAQSNEYIAIAILDDEIDGHERRIANNMSQLVICKRAVRIHTALFALY